MPDDTSSVGTRHVTVAQTPFAMVPEAVIYDHRLTDKAQRLYACLLRHGTDPENCYPSHKRLAELIGCSERSIARPMNELIEAGWIERVKRPAREDGSRQTDGYFVHTTAQESATHNAQERGGTRSETSSTAQENVDPPRSTARTHRAEERGEREPLERKPPKERGTAALVPARPANYLDFVDDPSSAVQAKHKANQVIGFADARSKEPFTQRDKTKLRSWLPEVVNDYEVGELVEAIIGSPWRSHDSVMGQLRKNREERNRPRSVGDRGAAEARAWIEETA